MTTTQSPSILTASAILRELVAVGVTRFAYCAGSRNAPFGHVLSRMQKEVAIECASFAEERGAAFWAVGALQGDPSTGVAIITTSGTAAAELHPAIEEAKHAGLPLIAITADRPFELRGVGANQTTTQLGMYASSVVGDLEVPALDALEEAQEQALAGRVRRLVARARGFGGTSGPVHMNVCLREPLIPAPNVALPATSAATQPVPTATIEATPWSQVVDPSLRTLIVAGDGPGQDDGSDMREVAQAAALLDVPLIAEPSSGLCDLPTWLPHGPLVASELLALPKDSSVQQVVVLGRPTLSRPLQNLLARMGQGDTRKIVVCGNERWQDAAGTATQVVARLGAPGADTSSTQESRQWLQNCRALAARVEGVVRENSEGLSHLGAARMIWRHSANVNLWLAASNVVRSFDLGAAAPGARFVYSNRGLAGIDGTVASALGLACATGVATRAVLGDLSFCYDLVSLPARPTGEQNVQLIVFDDGGGSIFHSLEHGAVADRATYRQFFGVPQEIDICAAADACGWRAASVDSIAQLRQVVMAPIEGRSLVRVPLGVPADSFRRLFAQAEAYRTGDAPTL